MLAYLCDENYPEFRFPKWYPFSFFEVVDSRLSKYWEIGQFDFSEKYGKVAIISFPEWARDATFYERLVDGDPEALKVFEKYKTLIDAE